MAGATKKIPKSKSPGSGRFIPIPQDGVELIASSPAQHFRCYVDRARSVLHESVDSLIAKKTWYIPLGYIGTLLLTFSTANFNKTFLNISGESWKGAFIVALILSVAWLITAIYKAIRARNIDINSIVNRMRGDDYKD